MNVFVSGPLMFREVILAVTGKTFTAQCGLLRGYARLVLNDDSGQSAMIPFPDRAVDGVVYCDVDDESLKRMDDFLGRRFERCEVTVEAENGEWLEAEAYELKAKDRIQLTAHDWDEDDYRQNHLKKVLASCRT